MIIFELKTDLWTIKRSYFLRFDALVICLCQLYAVFPFMNSRRLAESWEWSVVSISKENDRGMMTEIDADSFTIQREIGRNGVFGDRRKTSRRSQRFYEQSCLLVWWQVSVPYPQDLSDRNFSVPSWFKYEDVILCLMSFRPRPEFPTKFQLQELKQWLLPFERLFFISRSARYILLVQWTKN